MHDKYLLCTDLDRTLIPNGDLPEPDGARDQFRNLISNPDIALAYVSGRSRELVQNAIREHELPQPDYVIADVGASQYYIDNGRWMPLEEWQQKIAKDWNGQDSMKLRHQLDMTDARLKLQPESGQSRFKLSFEMSPSAGLETEAEKLQHTLDGLQAKCNLISSIDETRDRGLVDILPASANKRFAIEFLAQQLRISIDRVCFAGDSGNDLDVILSPIKSVLVGNATDSVKASARNAMSHQGGQSVYFAAACYAAGIVEGFLHYYPQVKNDFSEGSNIV